MVNKKESFTLEATFREVRPPERLVYVFDDRAVTVTLDDVGGKTKVTIELTLETEYHEDLQRQGWSEHLENLETYLATAKK